MTLKPQLRIAALALLTLLIASPARADRCDDIAAQLKGAFASSFTPLDRSGDVFSWDPV